MMSLRLTEDQVRLLRLRAQRLIPSLATPGLSAEQVLTEVCGVQGQELPAARLSLHARGERVTLAEIETARQVTRTLVRTWVMRGTLHLVTTPDVRWLVPLLAPLMINGNRKRMHGLGWDEERTARGLRLLEEALARQGDLIHPEIKLLLKTNGLPFEGQAPIHLIFRAAWEGILIQGADRGKQPAFVSCTAWIGGFQPRPREAALAELARRYLQGYAPAAPADLAAWSGLKSGEARQAFQMIEDLLAPVDATGQPAWMLKTQLPWLDELAGLPPVVRLLPRFDTYLLGYANRELMVRPQFAGRINPGGGLVHQVVMVDSYARGLWQMKASAGKVEVIIEPFQPLDPRVLPGLEAEVASLGRFLSQQTRLKLEGQ
jgi:hypothetical protein